MSYGIYIIYFLVAVLLLYLLRFMYVKYKLRSMYRTSIATGVSERPNPHVTYAPYFIRLRSMAEARIQEQRRQGVREAEDLPPAYHEIVQPDCVKLEIIPTHKPIQEDPPPPYREVLKDSKGARPDRF